MIDSTLWLALSLGLVAISITALFVVALPAVIELGRAARSAEKLFDTLNRELPPVLDAMRVTGQELGELTDGVGESVEKAGQLVQQVDQGVQFVKEQAGQAQQTSRSVIAGARAAWRVFRQPSTAETDRLGPRSTAPDPPSEHSKQAKSPVGTVAAAQQVETIDHRAVEQAETVKPVGTPEQVNAQDLIQNSETSSVE
ncbi:MAG: hypothetical protein WBA10_13200 [Elainellaceae cyanobacterium]